MAKETDNQLVGKCPICSGPEPSSGDSVAYNPSTIVDSDKDYYLEWSHYYQQYVCRLCKIDGIDLDVDEIRDEDEEEKEYSRQKMGFLRTYTKN